MQVGVSVGVLLNSILPNWILTILLIVLIFLLSVQSVMKVRGHWMLLTMTHLLKTSFMALMTPM